MLAGLEKKVLGQCMWFIDSQVHVGKACHQTTYSVWCSLQAAPAKAVAKADTSSEEESSDEEEETPAAAAAADDSSEEESSDSDEDSDVKMADPPAAAVKNNKRKAAEGVAKVIQDVASVKPASQEESSSDEEESESEEEESDSEEEEDSSDEEMAATPAQAVKTHKRKAAEMTKVPAAFLKWMQLSLYAYHAMFDLFGLHAWSHLVCATSWRCL